MKYAPPDSGAEAGVFGDVEMKQDPEDMTDKALEALTILQEWIAIHGFRGNVDARTREFVQEHIDTIRAALERQVPAPELVEALETSTSLMMEGVVRADSDLARQIRENQALLREIYGEGK